MIYKNNYNNIYVEINDRQTGKTHRLCNDIVNYINKTNEDVYILTFKKENYFLIRNRIIGMVNTNFNFNKIHYIIDTRILKNTERVYVDEFAYIEDLDNRITIRENMYFVTSTNENNNSKIVKTLINFTHWKRKKIIDKLLNGNK